MKYKMKNLGYKRTPTSAKMTVEFSNGEVYEIPVQILADRIDEYYKDKENQKCDIIASIKSHLEGPDRQRADTYKLWDWAANNMHWEDLAPYAQKIKEATELYYETEYNYGYVKITISDDPGNL